MKRSANRYLLLLACSLAACERSDASSPPDAPSKAPELDSDHAPLLRLRAPRWDDWASEPPAPKIGPIQGLGAEAFHFKGIVYDRADKDAKSTGVVRRGRRIQVRERVFGSGCDDGGWYAVEPYGYVCTSDGFWVSKTARDPEPDAAPSPERRIPYQYAKVTTENAPRFFAVPEPRELLAARAASTGDNTAPDVVEKLMDGIYLLALRPDENGSSEGFRRTVRGRFVATEDVAVRPNVPMRGVLLDDGQSLPIAFTYGTERKIFRQEDGQLFEVGMADKHARLSVVGKTKIDGQSYIQGPNGQLLARSAIRMAESVQRPDRIPSGRKWIHVHLPEQTLVAYEGDRPVLATLVSSGIEGFDTPAGVYQIQHKYLSVTMNGPDPDEGFYEVEEVPWTMYYFESFALHGAYWHNDFGKVRSHGCTNIPPADARWLYYWSDPEVPPGWHAATRRPGTYVYITKNSPV